jgi:hypothetical protein
LIKLLDCPAKSFLKTNEFVQIAPFLYWEWGVIDSANEQPFIKGREIPTILRN